MGKALGGGILPISAIGTRDDVLGVLKPGEHGSTFGGNPLALAVGREVVALLRTGEMQQRSQELGTRMLQRIKDGAPDLVEEVRGRGLWAGVQVKAERAPVRPAALRSLEQGVIVKDTQVTTLRIAPPIVIEESISTTGWTSSWRRCTSCRCVRSRALRPGRAVRDPP